MRLIEKHLDKLFKIVMAFVMLNILFPTVDGLGTITAASIIVYLLTPEPPIVNITDKTTLPIVIERERPKASCSCLAEEAARGHRMQCYWHGKGVNF